MVKKQTLSPRRFVKTFLYVLYKSTTDVKYYKEILETKIRFSFKYFFMLAVFATITTTASVVIPIVPKIKDTAGEFINKMVAIYPEELVITGMDGNWKINQEEPYTIATPDWMADEKGNSGLPSNLIIFDHNGTLNDFKEKNTLFLVNKVNLIALGSNKIEIHSLDKIPDGTFTENNIIEISNHLQNLTKYIPYILIITVTIGTFLYFFVWKLIYLVAVAIVLMLLSLFRKTKIPFKNAYRIGLHTCTLPIMLEVAFSLSPFNTSFLPGYWFILVNVVFGTIVIFSTTD